MKRGDKAMLFIFIALLLLTLTSYFISRLYQTEKLVAEIRSDGVLIKEVPLSKELSEEIVVEYKNGKNIIIVENDKIAVISADCPDKDCVRRGWLRFRGDFAICLPNHLSIRVLGSDEVDAVTF